MTEKSQTKKLLNRVNKLERLSKILHSAPLKKFNRTSIILLHTGIEIELERLSKIFNETSVQLNLPIRIKQKDN